MIFTIVVNNYNYGQYLREALDSVLDQTVFDWQLIVVDDGSTDDSLEILNGYSDPRIEVVRKENAGQLSCFNAALPLVRGDVVCLLDSDDVYESHYLETLQRVYEAEEVDFVFCNMRFFGAREGTYFSVEKPVTIEDSYYLTRFTMKYIGGPSSGLSMRRGLFEKILPLKELESDWVTCGDTPLVWGASLHHGRKYYLPECLVRYRKHGSSITKGLDSLQGEAERRLGLRFRSSWRRYADRFPDSWLLWDFLKVLDEFSRSPIPLQYKDLLGKRLWWPGRLLAKAVAKWRRHPDLFNF